MHPIGHPKNRVHKFQAENSTATIRRLESVNFSYTSIHTLDVRLPNACITKRYMFARVRESWNAHVDINNHRCQQSVVYILHSTSRQNYVFLFIFARIALCWNIKTKKCDTLSSRYNVIVCRSTHIYTNYTFRHQTRFSSFQPTMTSALTSHNDEICNGEKKCWSHEYELGAHCTRVLRENNETYGIQT